VQLSGEERAGDPVKLDAMDHISEFRLEGGTPVWRYEIGEIGNRKDWFCPHGQNTSFINYSLLSGDDNVRPGAAAIDSLPAARNSRQRRVGIFLHADRRQDRYEVSAGTDLPPLASAPWMDRTRR